MSDGSRRLLPPFPPEKPALDSSTNNLITNTEN